MTIRSESGYYSFLINRQEEFDEVGLSKEFRHNVIAIVYDFDGTLTPQPMQEYTVLPEIGIKDGKKFWEQVNKEAARTNGEAIVTYMRLMLEKSKLKGFPVTAEKLRELAKKMNYFPGVQTYFKRINAYIKKEFGRGIEVRHYVISGGLKEIISGASIAKYFYKIFAEQFAKTGQNYFCANAYQQTANIFKKLKNFEKAVEFYKKSYFRFFCVSKSDSEDKKSAEQQLIEIEVELKKLVLLLQISFTHTLERSYLF